MGSEALREVLSCGLKTGDQKRKNPDRVFNIPAEAGVLLTSSVTLLYSCGGFMGISDGIRIICWAFEWLSGGI